MILPTLYFFTNTGKSELIFHCTAKSAEEANKKFLKKTGIEISESIHIEVETLNSEEQKEMLVSNLVFDIVRNNSKVK